MDEASSVVLLTSDIILSTRLPYIRVYLRVAQHLEDEPDQRYFVEYLRPPDDPREREL